MRTLLLGGGAFLSSLTPPTPKDVYKLLGVQGPTPKDVYKLLGVQVHETNPRTPPHSLTIQAWLRDGGRPRAALTDGPLSGPLTASDGPRAALPRGSPAFKPEGMTRRVWPSRALWERPWVRVTHPKECVQTLGGPGTPPKECVQTLGGPGTHPEDCC